MIGFNGGLIGGFRDTTTGTASVPGVWTANEQVVARRRGLWVEANDPFFSSVSLLLPGDGTNGSTSIIDRSPSPKTITVVGNAQISTAQSKFGGASMRFDGNGDYISEPGASGQYAFGTGNFTVEFWMYALDATTRQGLYSNNLATANTGPVFAIRGIGTTAMLGVGNVAEPDKVQTANNAFSVNQWEHIALVRSGTGANQTKIYVNGVEMASGTMIDNYGSNREMNIGRTFNFGEHFNGYIDDLRITKGVARYTSNFTPPTAPHPLF